MLFWMTPAMMTIAIYVLAAVLPAVFLLRYIYRQDTVEKEPAGLLMALLVRGVVAALLSGVLEGIGGQLLGLFPVQSQTLYIIMFAFLVVAVVEEGTKYLLMKHCTWNDPNFNCSFDGIVYAVFTSLGFAAFENIRYVFHYGLSVALPRALLAVPGHMSFAVVMGVLYGRARRLENHGHHVAARMSRRLGYVLAVCLHGFYDTCAMIDTNLSMMVFFSFVAIMFLSVFRLVRKESEKDEPIIETP